MHTASAVIILGAGSSAAFGVPTLRNLFLDDNAQTYLGNHSWLRNQLQRLIWEPRGHSLATSDKSLNIEEILTLVRDSTEQQWGLQPLLTDDHDRQRFRRGLYSLIKCAVYDDKSSSPKHLNPLIAACQREFRRTTWATFNWDCLFEASFYYSGGPQPFDRCNPHVVVPLEDWKDGPCRDTLLKLHGGVNWWYRNGHIRYLSFGRGGELTATWREYESGSRVGRPLILEPSYYKYNDPLYKRLARQWKIWVKRLTSADVVLVVGYSLPQADWAARAAVTLGFQNNPRSQWVIVDPSQRTCSRYVSLLGRSRVRVYRSSLSGLKDDWNKILAAALSKAAAR